MSVFTLSIMFLQMGTLSGSDKNIKINAETEKHNTVQRMLKEINQFRKVSGLKPVVYNESYARFEQGISERNQKNNRLEHSKLDTSIVSGDVMAMESIAFGYQPEESVWAYISDNASTMGHCHSLLIPDRAMIGIGVSGAYNSLFVSSSSSDMQIAKKVCTQLNQKPLSEVRAYIWNQTNNPKPENKKPSVNYQANVQRLGWLSPGKDGAIVGTVGQGLRIETLRIGLLNLPVPGEITYSAYTQKTGWQTPVSNNQVSGTVGQNTAIEAINVKITGAIAQQYDIYYRVNIQNFGWLGWAKNGVNAGSEGKSLRIEALQLVMMKKGDKVPETNRSFVKRDGSLVPLANDVPSVSYQSNIQKIGWQAPAKDGSLSGTINQGLRIETLRIALLNPPITGGITYSAYTQKTGWQTPVSNNQVSGTIGQNTAIEAINVKLTGAIAQQYDVYYRVNIQNNSWLGWTKNGEIAGSVGKSLRMEALEVKLVKKGEKSPVMSKAFLN